MNKNVWSYLGKTITWINSHTLDYNQHPNVYLVMPAKNAYTQRT